LITIVQYRAKIKPKNSLHSKQFCHCNCHYRNDKLHTVLKSEQKSYSSTHIVRNIQTMEHHNKVNASGRIQKAELR